eukprot:1137803-Pelagomonas_calceolata.AAC.1
MANNATSCSHALGCNMHWAIYNNIYNRLQSLNVLHQAATIQWAAAMHWAATMQWVAPGCNSALGCKQATTCNHTLGCTHAMEAELTGASIQHYPSACSMHTPQSERG